jgi:hypothetical protein
MVHSSFIAVEGDSSGIEMVGILIGVDSPSCCFPCDVMMELTWRMLFPF